MVAKAEKVDNPAEIKASAADGYQAGVAFCEISCGGSAGFLALSAGFLVLSAFTAHFLVGPPLLWGIAGVNSKPPKGLMKEIQQSKGQEYVAGFVKGYNDKNKKQKRYAVVKGGVITFILVYALLSLTQDMAFTT